MSKERLTEARELLRQEFIEYVEALATDNASDDDIDQIPRLRQAIDALDHAIDEGWGSPRSRFPQQEDPFDEAPGG